MEGQAEWLKQRRSKASDYYLWFLHISKYRTRTMQLQPREAINTMRLRQSRSSQVANHSVSSSFAKVFRVIPTDHDSWLRLPFDTA
jgi:hypothetical protein